jgi:hypothetical protein
MNYELQTYATEKKAIRAARQSAIESARLNNADSEEKVLLNKGDTLIITATDWGRISEKVCGGHILAGHVFCSKKLSEKF